MGPAGKERGYMKNPGVGSAVGTASVYLGGVPLSERGNPEMAPGSAYTSAAVKYGLPVAGITAAGAGLIHLTNQFGTAADEQTPGELSMNSGGVALASGGAGAAATAMAGMLMMHEMQQSDARMEREFDEIRQSVRR